MQVGFLGLPGAGKSTLFHAVHGNGQVPSGRPQEPRSAVVRVPDPRVEHLSQLFHPRKTTLAEIVFVDPARGRGDEPAGTVPESVLESVRGMDLLVLVVRAFEAPEVPRQPGSASAAEDLQRLEEELILRDLERVEKRLQRLQKEGKKAESAAERQLLEKLRSFLEEERSLREASWSDDEAARMRGFQFLSLKPALVVMNVDEEALMHPSSEEEPRKGRRTLTLSARIEQELAELEPEEQQEFLKQLGLHAPARDVFVRSAFELLDLLSFFTVGEDEVRAWPVRRGSTAPVAAGRIHSDLQKGFIRAEVIHYDEFVRVGSLPAARSQGLLRLEGKQYVLQDGDIMHVRHA